MIAIVTLLRRREGKRRPDVGAEPADNARSRGVGQRETRWCDAGHDVRIAAQPDGAADDRGIAYKAPLPKAVAEDGEPPFGFDIPRREVASHRGWHRRDIEIARRHPHPGDALGLTGMGQVEGGRLRGRGGLEGGRLRRPIVKMACRRGPGATAQRLAGQHDAIGVSVRQRPQQHAVHHAEHCCG